MPATVSTDATGNEEIKVLRACALCRGLISALRYGGFAEEFEDVSRNLRSVDVGRNPNGNSSFFIFYSVLDILTMSIKITLTDFKNRNKILLTKVTVMVTKI